MDKKLVFVFLAGSAIGVVAGQIPGAEVKAGISQLHRHIFQGVAPAWLVTTIESGLAAQAASHANAALGLTGADALSHTDPAQCPVTAINLHCRVTEENIREWKWEYQTRDITGTWSVGAPQ